MSKHKTLTGFVVEVGPNMLNSRWTLFGVCPEFAKDQAVAEVNFYEAFAEASANIGGETVLLADHLGERDKEETSLGADSGLDVGDDPRGPLLDQIKEEAIAMMRADPNGLKPKHFTFCVLDSTDVDVTLKPVIEDDAELSAEELEDKYSPRGGGEHPAYHLADWRAEVSREGTICGYWAWVEAQIVADEEEDE